MSEPNDEDLRRERGCCFNRGSNEGCGALQIPNHRRFILPVGQLRGCCHPGLGKVWEGSRQGKVEVWEQRWGQPRGCSEGCLGGEEEEEAAHLGSGSGDQCWGTWVLFLSGSEGNRAIIGLSAHIKFFENT